MKEIDISERLAYLAEEFDVFDCSDKEELKTRFEELTADGYRPVLIYKNHVTQNFLDVSDLTGVIAIYSVKQNEKERLLKKVSVCSDIFSEMISADPTKNKMYLQWMLNLFARLIKDGKEQNKEAAIRLVSEDLPQANQYLTLFDENKRKKKFSELCKGNYTLMHVTDPSDINQYKSLAQLFDVVDPFIEKEPSALERTLQKFVDAGQAVIPVKDRKFTVFIPKTRDANVAFDNFASWCTAKKDNGMFKSYTEGHKKPNGKNSDIYIIIDNRFFSGESDVLYQIHFESNQIKNRQNGQNISIFETVLSESEGLTNFFYEELMGMAKENKNGWENNKYLDFLIQFGFAESLFELMDEQTPLIRFMTREIPRLPDISRFKKLDQLIITGAKLVELHPSIGKLASLEMLVLSDNRIKELPKEIGNLKNLTFLNLTGNPIKSFPEEIKYLDKSNGGSLYRLGVKEGDIGEDNYKKLKALLPKTLPFSEEKS